MEARDGWGMELSRLVSICRSFLLSHVSADSRRVESPAGCGPQVARGHPFRCNRGRRSTASRRGLAALRDHFRTLHSVADSQVARIYRRYGFGIDLLTYSSAAI